MKILHVIPYFVPAWAYGGPVKVVFEITRRLVKKGYRVTVFTTDVLDEKKRIIKREEKIEGVNIYRFRTVSNWLSWHFNGFLSPGMVTGLIRKAREFDLIHLHEYYTFQSIIIPLIARRYNIPYVIFTHGSILEEKERGRFLIKKIFNFFFRKMIFFWAAYIFVLNEAEKKILEKFGVEKGKIIMVPNGLNLDEYINLPARGQVRKALSINKKEKIILFVGRIYRTKGLELLIKALVYLDKGLLKNLRLLLVGPVVGNYENELLALAKRLKVSSKIIFTGGVYGDKKLKFFRDSDLYVQPSYSDGFPISVLEALACGLPVLVTRGTNLFFLAKKKAVLMVRNEPKEIARGIEKIFEQNDLAEELVKVGQRTIKESLTWDKILNKITLKYSLFKK